MSERHEPIPEDRVHFLEGQEILLEDFDAAGFTLDIGGGGEGIIGALKGEKVVAIDPRREELEEAADGPLKIVMDARDLQFLDETFNTATSFFTLMYLNQIDDLDKVFREIFRMLTAGGRLLIWDVNLPERIDESKDVFVVPVLVKLPDREIEAGYGQLWPGEVRDVAFYVQFAQRAGFEVGTQTPMGQAFYLELRKPVALS